MQHIVLTCQFHVTKLVWVDEIFLSMPQVPFWDQKGFELGFWAKKGINCYLNWKQVNKNRLIMFVEVQNAGTLQYNSVLVLDPPCALKDKIINLIGTK